MTLQLIAANMAAQLAQTGQPVRLGLERGLHLVLWRDGLDTILSLTREGTVPSVAEVKACQNAFGLPANVAVEEDQVTWHIVRLRWGSVEGPAQEPLFEPPPPPENHHYRGNL